MPTPSKTGSLVVLGLLLFSMVTGCASRQVAAPTTAAVREKAGSADGPGVLTNIVAKTLVSGLREPWGMDFLPDGRILVTEITGAVNVIEPDSWQPMPLAGVPASEQQGQGGMMDVLVHPRFERDPWIYLSYTTGKNGLYSTRVSRARLRGLELVDHEVLFTAEPFFEQRRHFGSRLLIDEGYLYITVGDRGNRDLAQSLQTHNGKVLRLRDNGAVPADNPFSNTPGARPEIYTYGHRNPQGIARHPFTGAIWLAEHGPRGGDEINILSPGANYGWPVITYGREYSGGTIGEGTHRDGMEQPVKYYPESPGVSGIDFYTGQLYSGWSESLLVSSLRFTRIDRLRLDGDGLGQETHLLENLQLRIRDLQVGPDGMVYALAGGSRLIRLEPRP